MPAKANLERMPGATSFIHHVDDPPAYWMQGILWSMLADATVLRRQV